MSKLVSTKAMTKVAAVATGLAMVAGALTFASTADAASLTSTQIQSILSLLSSFGASSATIANVNAALTGQPSTTTTTTTTSSSCSFSGALTIGSSGAQVTCLQTALIGAGYSIPAGATGYFGAQTQAAVAAWQKANGVTPAVGYFGAISQAHWNLGGGSTTTTTTGTGTVTIGSGNGLKVGLSATSPNGTVLVQGQGIGDLGDYVFSNPTTAPITVTGLTFNRIGVSNDSTLNNVYLYNGVTRITDSAGVSSSQFSFNNAGGIFTVGAGQTYTVSVRADIAAGTAGQELGVSLVSVASSGTLDSTDSFPINSGYQTISAATLATVDFNATTLPSANVTVSPQTGYTLWQNTVSISQNPVWLQSMTFTNLGSISASDLANLTLYVDGTQVGSGAISSGRTLTFNLASNPVELNTGSHVIRLAGDIIGGSSFNAQFSIQYSSDAMFVDSQLNQPVTPTKNGATFSAVSTAVVTIQSVNNGGGVSVSKDPASPTNDIAKGASSVNLATFDMLASGEPTKVNDLYVCATVAGGGAGTGAGLQNGKIYFNGVQVGSTKNIPQCNGTSNFADFSLGSSLILPASQTAQVSIYADARTSTTTVAGGSTITATLVQGSSNAQGQDSLASVSVPSGNTSGNTLNVTSSSLSASEASGYGNQGAVAGTNHFKIGSFVLQAGSTENLNVNSIGLDLDATNSPQNLMLVDDGTGTQIGTTIASPAASHSGSISAGSGSVNTFSTNFTLPVSSTKTIDIYADIPSSAGTASTIATSVDHSATNATGATTGTNASISANVLLQTITVGSGSLNVALGASNPVASNVVAGSSNLEVADYTFSANTSSYTVRKLELTMPAASSSAVSNVTVQYKDVNGATQTATAALVSNGTTATSSFSGLTLYVPANSSSDLSVWVSTPTVTSGQTTISGTQIAFSLQGSDGTNVQVQDASGNVTNSINSGTNISSIGSGYGYLVLRKSVPTFAGQSYSSTASPNTGTVLYQFTVSADPAGAVDFKQFSFNVSKSGAENLDNFQLYDAANPSNALNTAVASSSGKITVLTTNVVQVPAGSSKTFILKATTGTFPSSSSLSINLAPADTTLITNAAESGLTANNYIWTDRAANSDSTGDSQWTNGYLLRDLVDGTYSFTTGS